MTNTWETRQLRATFFVGDVISIASGWWQDFTGQAPEVEEKRARENFHRVAGAFAGAYFSIISSPARLDLIMEALPLAEGEVPNFVFGNADELIAIFEERIGTVCDKIPSTNRIAFGGVVVREQADHLKAYGELALALKSLKVVPGKMRDLLYRVNWPVVAADKTPINRLTSWSALSLKATAQPTTGGSAIQLFDRSYFSLEFDINTAQVNDNSFSASQCRQLFIELTTLAKENMAEGEVISP